jgi:hypothetical protein
MNIPEDLVRLANESLARIALSEARTAELPIELAQLAAVAEAVRPRVAFDQEVAEFSIVLRSLAWKE